MTFQLQSTVICSNTDGSVLFLELYIFYTHGFATSNLAFRQNTCEGQGKQGLRSAGAENSGSAARTHFRSSTRSTDGAKRAWWAQLRLSQLPGSAWGIENLSGDASRNSQSTPQRVKKLYGCARERRVQMSRGKTCTICAHPERPAIDALLSVGTKLKDVAAQFVDTSVHAITRHRRKCLGISATGARATDGDSLQEKCSLWLQRADSLYVSSGAALDLRGQRDAIAAAFRALEFRFKHEERLAEKELHDLPLDALAWSEEEGAKFRAYCDSIVAEAAATNYASDDVRKMGLELVIKKRPELSNLFQTIAQDPELFSKVQQICNAG